jgi:hypothetical protein
MKTTRRNLKLLKEYCYMCEVSLVVALALLQQCNSTSRFLSYATMKTDVSTQQCKQRRYYGKIANDRRVGSENE